MGKPSEVTEKYFLRLTTTKTPTDKRHRGQLCTAGLAALALQQCRPSGALLSLIARRDFGQNALWTACGGQKAAPLRLHMEDFEPRWVSRLQQHQEEAMGITAGDRAVSEMQPVSRQDETDLLGEE